MTALPTRPIVLRSLVLLALLLPASWAAAQPTFDKGFFPGTVGLGNVSQLTFTIQEVDGVPTDDIAFVDLLPVGMTIASAPTASISCTGMLDAPAGGSTISLTGGRLGPGETCTIQVDVVGGTLGVLSNTTGDLTSTSGNSGTATADLTVDANRLRFSKAFSPSTILVGQTSRLTFDLVNPSGSNVFNTFFSDILPPGLQVATPGNATTNCVATFTPVDGATSVSLFSGFLMPGASCSASVDVVATAPGLKENSTFTLQSTQGNAGEANATLLVQIEAFRKSFSADIVAPGQTVDLEFTIDNLDRNFAATDVTFTDDFDAMLTGLVAVGLPQNDVCGAGSQIAGSSVLTLSGGTIPAEGSCTFSVTLQVPVAATSGTYTNTTSPVSLELDGMATMLNAAVDTLQVAEVPLLTKTFIDDPVIPSGTVTLEFTIQNTSATSAISAIRFVDNLDAVVTGMVPTLPANGFCGPGSNASVTTVLPPNGALQLVIQNGSLPAGGSCTFQVPLTLPLEVDSGIYPNVTSSVTATRDADSSFLFGPAASDDLVVVAAPSLQKRFTDDPVVPGGTVTLEFTLENDENAPGDATGITFIDDLDAALTGLVSTSGTLNDICGVGSQLSGTSPLTFTGGTLAPGASCTFSVTAQVPAATPAGSYPNTTSAVSATVVGTATTSLAATDTLEVAGLILSMSFLDDPVVPGGTMTLEYTLSNAAGTTDVTGATFSHVLDAVLPGLSSATPTQLDVCGTGSQFVRIFADIYSLVGGNLLAGETCSFQIVLDVPAGAALGPYFPVTSSLTAIIGGSSTVFPPASDSFLVFSPLSIAKEFTDDPATSPGTVTLEFTISNASATDPITGITFTDDLGATLTGLVATGLPQNDVCGVGSTLSGTSLITLTGGQVAPASSCTFSVTLQVPAGVSLGSVTENVTSTVSGQVGAATVTGVPARDTLLVRLVEFTKAFRSAGAATSTVDLEFTIQNLGGNLGSVSFQDDLDAVFPGLVAIGLPQNDVCGAGSQLSGTSVLALSGGALAAGTSCTFTATLQVPAGVAAGSYLNTTTPLTSAGLTLANPASASLQIEPPPTFAKAFTPSAIGLGQTTTLTFTIDNAASTLDASSLSFVDMLPAGLEVAAAPNVVDSCGATVGAMAGATSISVSGGSVVAGASCTISVDLTATATGDLLNTSSALSTSNGEAAAASAMLRVDPQPGFTKAFAPTTAGLGVVSTLTLTIDNTAATNAATALDFTDTLPAGLVVATPPNASTTCTGGTLTAVAGTGTVTYTGGTVAAAATCAVQVEVVVTVQGPTTLVNTTLPLTSSLGDSGTASASLDVDGAPGFAKSFAPTMVGLGVVSTLTLTIDNTAASNAAMALDVTDPLPAGLVVATPPNASTTCTGGTVTAAAGSSTVSYTGGTVAAAATCTVQADVVVTVQGPTTLVNTTQALTSSLGDSGTASASLDVDPPPTFAKAFAPTTIAAGGVSTLTLTIDNTAAANAAMALDVTDTLPAGLEVATPPNASTTCAGGTVTAVAGSDTVSYTGGTVAAGATCTVQADITAPADGSFVNLTGDLTSSLGNSGTATATLTVKGTELSITKTFLADPVLRGGTVQVEFTIANESGSFGATGIGFTDDLDAALTGLVAAGLPANDVCGAGSQLDGTSLLTLTGGNLGASASCTFTVDLVVPPTAPLGVFTNTTSAVTGTVDGVVVTGPTASDSVEVVFIDFTKEFIGEAILGGDVVLRFTLMNPDSVNTITGLGFTDDLDVVLPGLVAIDLPQSDVCGVGSLADGTSTITLTDGVLGPSESCSFDVTLEIPGSATPDTYLNLTSPLDGVVGGQPVSGDPAGAAQADLIVGGTILEIPTLGQWGLVLLALLLGVAGVRRLRF
ncbi:MAG: IPTL-CTERM sorting domain-containing protein [Acidobacteriota bacterium]